MAFNKNRIIPDSYLTSYQPIDVERFLKKVNSTLVAFEIDGQFVSKIIEDECKNAGIAPRFILTKLQVEQSLLFKKPTQDKLDWALGYGCPDSSPRLTQYKGFCKQVSAAAKQIKAYLDPKSQLYVGKEVRRDWKVSDGTVRCENIATAALYRYTPWIGEDKLNPIGNYLFYLVWQDLFGQIDLNEDIKPPDPQIWRLIVPPDNWQEPLSLSDSEKSKILQIADRLGLVKTEDIAAKKLYLGLPEHRHSPVSSSDIRQKIAEKAEFYLTSPSYPYASENKRCAHFVSTILTDIGIMNHPVLITLDILKYLKEISKGQIERGDIIFIDQTYNAVDPPGIGPEDTYTHVVIYMGDNQVIHHSSTAREIRKDSLDVWAGKPLHYFTAEH